MRALERSTLFCISCALLVGACSDDTKAPDKSVVNPDRGLDVGVTPDVSKFPKSEGPSSDAKNKVDVKSSDGPKPDTKNPCHVLGAAQPSATPGIKNKADILFVIDDSLGSLAGQSALLGQMTAFETALEANNTEYHIGVVTTDLGAGPYVLPQCSPCGDDGQLHKEATTDCNWGAPAFPQQLFLAKGSWSDWKPMLESFKCVGLPGQNGCGFEQPLESAAVFLTNASLSSAGSLPFLRPEASLVLVFVTSEDDCSAKDTKLFNPADTSLGAVNSFRCFQQGITCNVNDRSAGPRTGCSPKVGGMLRDITDYVTLFKSMKPAGRVSVVTIAGPTTPVNVSLDTSSNPKLDPSCSTAVTPLIATPAIRLKAFTDAFGADGKFHTYCGGFAAAVNDVIYFAKVK